jgi:hypothetical protein
MAELIIPKKIFLLKKDPDNFRWIAPKFSQDGMMLVDKSIDDRWFRSGGKPISEKWKPIPITAIVESKKDELLPLPDYCDNYFPIFSSQAIDQLGEMLTENGEVLDLVSDVGDYKAFNLLTTIDCLDENRSQVERFADGVRIKRVLKYEFDVDKIVDQTIFWTTSLSAEIFVTESFVHRCRSLKGFNFTPVYESVVSI